jgi:hypothetical protein
MQQYDGAHSEVATQSRITSPVRPARKRNAILLAIAQGSHYIMQITARHGLLSVTESVALPPSTLRAMTCQIPPDSIHVSGWCRRC